MTKLKEGDDKKTKALGKRRGETEGKIHNCHKRKHGNIKEIRQEET